MATASTGRASLVTGKGSSFGSFRLTQFADDVVNHPNDTSQHLDTEQMAQAPRPSSGQNSDRMPSIAPSRTPQQDQHQANPALELVEITSNPLIEGVLGPNKDGRVRNPVPSKLKGKTDNKQGNFGVMHMGMSPGGKKTEAQGRDAAAERDAAARRTSENTASRAKAAQSEKYVPPKRRGLEASLSDSATNRGSPFAVSRDDHKQRARPLAPDETKFEQARLLTLLRSINPVTVVDQICKAVAYFGGIPGAPPPEDGIFPESANTKETGALFIGWLAEIFPDLSDRSPEIPKDIAQGSGKRKGARPSKGKAVATGAEGSSNEPPNSRNGYGFGPAISAPAWGLPQSLALVNTPVPAIPIPLNEGRQGGNAITDQSKPPRPSTPSKDQFEEVPNNNTSASKRRRGRPKGSRNKGRSEGAQSDTGVNNTQLDGHDQVVQASQSPELHAAAGKSVQPNHAPPEPSYVPISDSQPPAISKQPPVQQYPQQAWQTNPHQNQNQNQTGQSSHTSSIPPADELSPEERAVLEAFRNHGSEAMNIAPSPIAPPKTAPDGGQKRKRAPPKPKASTLPAASFSTPNSNPVHNSNVLPPNGEAAVGMTKDTLQWGARIDTSTPTAPPAKRSRQRKPKAPSTNDPPSRNPTTSLVSSATPPTAPSTIPDSTAASSQQSLPVSRPPAEGLEAHYERFANLSNQQNGRSHTPTTLQQQERQQGKPTVVTPQQSTPQIQQMQTQKSQQSNQQSSQQSNQQNNQQSIQREEQKMTQPTAARPSSTAFYNQRSQPATTYSQQYPSHQPSQLYGAHQPSPQMSNNSYRTSTTHTLSQASPQFPQTENTYRTASPHTIAQPSPSFSQPDTNFRTNSTHSLAQPSPSFSQAENAYRTPSTNSMAQPTPSYTSSRAPPQTQSSHQNHYNHFSDSSYIDLPTLESLGHAGSSGTANVSLSGGGPYGQSMGVGLGTSRSSATTNSLYGTSSGLSNTYDSGTNDLLRGVARPASNSNAGYGTTSSGLTNAFDTGTNEIREHLLRGMGRR